MPEMTLRMGEEDEVVGRLQAPHNLPAGRVKENLKESADVHWLNSLEGGNACLLVDSYRDLSDGIALEEAILLIEGLSACSSSSAHPADRLRRALATVEESRGRLVMPPRLLQPAFSQQVCRGDPSACGHIVAFLRQLQLLDNGKGSAGRRVGCNGRSGKKSVDDSFGETRDTGTRGDSAASAARNDSSDGKNRNGRGCNSDKIHPKPTPYKAPTSPRHARNIDTCCARPDDGHRFGHTTGTTSHSYKPARARNVPSRTRPMERFCPPPPQPPAALPPPPPPVPFRQLFEARRPPPAYLVETSKRQAAFAPNPAISMVAGNRRIVTAAAPVAFTKRAPALSNPEWDASTIRKRAVRSDGKLATGSVQSAAAAGARQGMTGSSSQDGKPNAPLFRRVDKAVDKAAPPRVADKAGGSGAGRKRADRRGILRWMGRLGVKVGWPLLTPEGAPCHDRLSSGKLLCELAAALDYTISGGRGLPLSEIPSCPGRFVLRGTCYGPANKNNAARSRHNVRTALAAFEVLGGVRGVWLRSEEAILAGDLEATWGLLGDLYGRYGRIRSLRVPRSRPQQQPQRPEAKREEVQHLQQQKQHHERLQDCNKQRQQQQRRSQNSCTPIQSVNPDPARPSPAYQRHRGASSAPHRGRGNPAAVSPPTTHRPTPAVDTNRVMAAETSLQALATVQSRPSVRPTDPGSRDSNPSPTGKRVPAGELNRRAVRGCGNKDLDRKLNPRTGDLRSTLTPPVKSEVGDARAPTGKVTPEQGKRSTGGSNPEVPTEQSNEVGQISGSGNATCLSRSRKIGDAGVLMSPSRAGERASAETARWRQWNPTSREPSLLGTFGQERGAELPVSPDKAVEEGRGSGESVCRTPSSHELATAGFGADISAVKRPSRAISIKSREAFQPLIPAGFPPPSCPDIRVESGTPVSASFLPPNGDAEACNPHKSGQEPRLFSVEEVSFVDSPLSKPESGLRRPGATCLEYVEEAGAFAESLAERMASHNLHELVPSVDGSNAHRPSEMRVAESFDSRIANSIGAVPLSLAGLTTLNDTTTHSVCIPLALSSDPFARGENSDLLPVAHLENMEWNSLI